TSVISSLENATSAPKLKTLSGLAVYFKIPAAILLNLEAAPTPGSAPVARLNYEEIRERVRMLMKINQIDQKGIAKILAIDPANVSAMLSSLRKGTLSLETVFVLAYILKSSVHEIVDVQDKTLYARYSKYTQSRMFIPSQSLTEAWEAYRDGVMKHLVAL